MKTLNKLIVTELGRLDADFRARSYLLAVSGGSDSVCLFHAFKTLGLNFNVAHCNFNLRGEESDGDEAFVRDLIEGRGIGGYFTSFQTATFAKKNKLSIQEAARKLRYDWFESIAQQNRIDYIVTAHHQDDLLETILINLTRGTGISGLKGIPSQSGRVIRPMLNISKQTIDTYIATSSIQYRHDSSNDSLKYSRNFLRHKVIPILDNVHQNAKKGMLSTVENMESVDAYLSQKLNDDSLKFVEEGKVTKVKNITIHSFYFVYHVLSKYGFTKSQVNNIMSSTQKGRLFYSQDFRLLKEEDNLIIQRNEERSLKENYILDAYGSYQTPFSIAIETYEGNQARIAFSDNVAWIDASKVSFPFILRKWREGDFFQPLGMKGKKKLSDFFIDIKLNQFEKEAVWVLESNGQICWVVGKRLSNEVKISPQTTKVIKIVTKQ